MVSTRCAKEIDENNATRTQATASSVTRSGFIGGVWLVFIQRHHPLPRGFAALRPTTHESHQRGIAEVIFGKHSQHSQIRYKGCGVKSNQFWRGAGAWAHLATTTGPRLSPKDQPKQV